MSLGKFNKSSSDTLFSIGDGTATDARHNAFEITTTGGKLHDKDIATTDLIPTSLPANGGNADTVGGKSVSDFYSADNPPIKSTNVSGTTNENGDIYLWGIGTGNIPISAWGSPNTVFSPFLNDDGSVYMLHAIDTYTDSPVANKSVNATVYYF